MIYNYEAAILKYFNAAIKDIRIATYAQDEEIFEAMSSVKMFPAFYYNRGDASMQAGKVMRVSESDGSFVNISPYTVTYHAYLLVENVAAAFNFCNQLRAQFNRFPAVLVNYQPIGEVKVQLRLLSLKVSEKRNAADKKGACRVVEIEWQSVLFLDDAQEKPSYPLVSGIRLYLSDGEHYQLIIDEDHIPGSPK